METKTYFASSVQAAMEVARRELGPDAMLVNSGPAPESARSFGRLEVTFAWYPGAKGKSEVAGLAASLGQTAPRPADATLRRGESGLEDIRREISALRVAIGRQPGSARPASAAAPEIDEQAVKLPCETGFEKDTARQIVGAAQGGAQSGGVPGDGILRELTARIPVAAFSPLQAEESRALAFIGPPGRGKTTSLIKIAVRYGLANRIPTRIYMAGTHGVGATEQMARYAAILGVPFQPVESFENLNLALEGERWKGLVLIDTPGGLARIGWKWTRWRSFLAAGRILRGIWS